MSSEADPEFTRLASVARAGAGYPFRGVIPQRPGGVFVVQMKNVTIGRGVDWPALLETRLPGKRTPDWLQAGDVLLVARGNRFYAVAVDDPPVPAVCAPHFYIIRTQEPRLLPAFLAWQLNQAPVQRHFERHAEGSVTKSIRRSVLENAPIAIPSVRQQELLLALQAGLDRQQRICDELLRNGATLLAGVAEHLLTNPAQH